MKKLFANLALFWILSSLCVTFAPITSAQDAVCTDFNNMYASSKCNPQQPNTQGATGTNCTEAKLPPSLANKLVVQIEEPLGAADNKTTIRCARQIVCTVGAPPAKPATKPATDGAAAAPAQPQATSTTPPLVRKCVTTYTAATACSATSAKDINDKLSKPLVDADAYTTCEPVMFYVSPAGTSLLYYYMGQIYRYMATLGGIVAVLTLIIAGVMRASAGDSPDRVSKANALVVKCISGLILLFLSAIILYIINPNFFVIS